MKRFYKLVGSARCANRTPQRSVPTLLCAAAILFVIIAPDRAQQPPVSHAQNFSTYVYYKPPNEQLVEAHLSGTNALPLPGGLLDMEELMIQTYNTNGALEVTARAPQCTYDLRKGTASSPGHLQLVSGDSAYQLEGDGFLFVWRTNETSLTLSNRVRTVIQNGILRL
jgi:hypothetical protein